MCTRVRANYRVIDGGHELNVVDASQSSSRSTLTRVSRTRLWPSSTLSSTTFSSALLPRLRVRFPVLTADTLSHLVVHRALVLLQEVDHLLARDPDSCPSHPPGRVGEARHLRGDQVRYEVFFEPEVEHHLWDCARIVAYSTLVLHSFVVICCMLFGIYGLYT